MKKLEYYVKWFLVFSILSILWGMGNRIIQRLLGINVTGTPVPVGLYYAILLLYGWAVVSSVFKLFLKGQKDDTQT